MNEWLSTECNKCEKDCHIDLMHQNTSTHSGHCSRILTMATFPIDAATCSGICFSIVVAMLTWCGMDCASNLATSTCCCEQATYSGDMPLKGCGAPSDPLKRRSLTISKCPPEAALSKINKTLTQLYENTY